MSLSNKVLLSPPYAPDRYFSVIRDALSSSISSALNDCHKKLHDDMESQLYKHVCQAASTTANLEQWNIAWQKSYDKLHETQGTTADQLDATQAQLRAANEKIRHFEHGQHVHGKCTDQNHPTTKNSDSIGWHQDQLEATISHLQKEFNAAREKIHQLEGEKANWKRAVHANVESPVHKPASEGTQDTIQVDFPLEQDPQSGARKRQKANSNEGQHSLRDGIGRKHGRRTGQGKEPLTVRIP
jgi:flagellar biosynthesis chaperone FliJ